MCEQTQTALRQTVRLHVGIDTVGEEYVDEVGIGVAPEDRAGKSLMPIGTTACLCRQNRVLGRERRGVETETAALAPVHRTSGNELPDRLFRKIGTPVINPAVHQHGEERTHLMCRGKEARIAAISAKQCSRLVMDIAF